MAWEWAFAWSWGGQHLEFKLAVAWDSLGNNYTAPSPPFVFILFVVAFFIKDRLCHLLPWIYVFPVKNN